MTTPIGYVPYTDRNAWRNEFRAFIKNEAPIVRSATRPTPLITVHPDRDLLALFRGHRRMPKMAGDCKVAYILSCDIPRPEAQLALKYTWTKPTRYTMTLVVQVPDCLTWLTPALQAGYAACGLAPHPELGFIGLPMPDGLQEQLVQVALSCIFHLRERNARRN